MNSTVLRTSQWLVKWTIGAIVLINTMIGVVTVMVADRDQGLMDSDVLISLRRNLIAFAEPGSTVRVAIFETPDAADTIPALISVLKREHRFEYQTMNAASIRNGDLRNADILLVPGGRASLKAQELSEAGQIRIREFIQGGGGYVGICGGAFLALSGQDWNLRLVNSRPLSGSVPCGVKGVQPMMDRGAGTVLIRFSSVGKRLFSVTKSYIPLQYSSGPIFGRGLESELPDFVVLARYDSELFECELQRYTMIHRPAIIAVQYGLGHVILFSPHPEMSLQYGHFLIEAIACCAMPRKI